MNTVEYRVRPVERFMVTRFESNGRSSQIETIGEYPNEMYATRVMEALKVHDPMPAELPPNPPPSNPF